MDDKLRLTWHGHACFTIDTGKKVVVDPFIEGNPVAKVKKDDIKADAVVISHGHFDHVGDAVYIARKNKAPIVTMVELAWILGEENKDVQVIGINLSGSTEVNGIRFTAVPAYHSTGYNGKYGGAASGFVIEHNGFTLYHAGDTGVFKDMELIGELYRPQISMLPIGGFYTMSPREAAYAVKMLRSKVTIPMHYNTFDAIKQDPQKFKVEAEKNGTRVVIMGVEETREFSRAELT
ncbi:metal-dependent hydrolase [Thermogymnomonas acidicola]|nr:metal-dependent hydrolase [Thermogymnomonas acidicola]